MNPLLLAQGQRMAGMHDESFLRPRIAASTVPSLTPEEVTPSILNNYVLAMAVDLARGRCDRRRNLHRDGGGRLLVCEAYGTLDPKLRLVVLCAGDVALGDVVNLMVDRLDYEPGEYVEGEWIGMLSGSDRRRLGAWNPFVRDTSPLSELIPGTWLDLDFARVFPRIKVLAATPGAPESGVAIVTHLT